MSPPLPFELIELIINHLPKLVDLQSAALISRAWFIPSQHALFRSLDLQDLPVARLCTHLRRYPHLQSYIHHVIMIQRDGYLGDPPNTDHLTAMFSLMPKLISLEISFDRYRLWGRSDELFVKAFGTFLRDTSSLNAIGIHGLRYEEDFQQMFLYLEDTMIKRVNLQLDGYDSDEDEDQDDHGRVKFFTSTLAVVRLPQVEIVRFQLWCPPLIIEGLKLWFLEHQTMFPRLKHLEIGLDDTEDFEFWLQDILHPIQTLRLESVRIEFDSSSCISP
ncbi:hypothetical protein CPB85DRAFT_772419 [Mucidula mucida]|nr:hypothetical protein CPB85DRAFT_772419 [Mucidula mucida]